MRAARAGVCDGQGEGFQLGYEGAELAVVVEPLPVVVELLGRFLVLAGWWWLGWHYFAR